MTFAQNCDMMEKTGRTRQGLPARFAIGYSQFIIGNTAQFPPCGLSTAPAAAARHLRCQNAR